ncbi:universal stress protein [Dactylosporangium sp. AC04546]|uniref:universal stress protein n=1 Tax=Dactylosporangium sp. AC04546 TaxID=2862460 RepID=UPI001EDCFF76|nr:universal stress protein [Dactylosporangium sp. AC04546]WVK78508.1 universal stress protein [Dactylosporangium sp. AC04546]
MPIRVLVGYDGSPAASAAITAAAELFPQAKALVAHLWTPPFADDAMRRRLWTGAAQIDDFVAAVEREGGREAARIAGIGVTLAQAAGWDAEPLVSQTYAGEGLQLAELAEQHDADLVLVGSRGLGGARAVLGSVSDTVVHAATRPVLVVPHPLLSTEYAALAGGPVLVGYDGSAGAQLAVTAAARLFPTRRLLAVTVDDGPAPAAPPAGTVELIKLPGRSGTPGRAVAGALTDCARDRSAAVLVVGSRGRSAVREILLGSVAMASLHRAHRPVLVAHGT